MSKTQKRKQPKNNAASKPSAASILLDTYLGEMSCIEPTIRRQPLSQRLDAKP